MRNSHWISGVIAMMATAGCSSREEPPPLSAARQLFEEDIMPLLNGVCADCHSNANDEHGAPDFLDTVDGQYYESLVARTDFVGCDVNNSLLLTKGLHEEHPGGKLTGPQHDKIVSWLLKEATDRFNGVCNGPEMVPGTGGGEMPPVTLTALAAMEQFRNCMTLEDWKKAEMPVVGETIALEGDTPKPCYSCHEVDGSGGNWMSGSENVSTAASIENVFNNMSKSKSYSIYRLVGAIQNDQDGSFVDIVQSYRWRDKSEDEKHPTYTLSSVNQGRVDTWFSLTYNKWKSGSCPN